MPHHCRGKGRARWELTEKPALLLWLRHSLISRRDWFQHLSPAVASGWNPWIFNELLNVQGLEAELGIYTAGDIFWHEVEGFLLSIFIPSYDELLKVSFITVLFNAMSFLILCISQSSFFLPESRASFLLFSPSLWWSISFFSFLFSLSNAVLQGYRTWVRM